MNQMLNNGNINLSRYDESFKEEKQIVDYKEILINDRRDFKNN